MDSVPKLYHEYDPTAPSPAFRWPFAYLHGEAETLMDSTQRERGWKWSAPDIFESDQPMPKEPGEYKADLYGKEVIVVVARRHSGLDGRAALVSDGEGLAHCREVDSWM